MDKKKSRKLLESVSKNVVREVESGKVDVERKLRAAARHVTLAAAGGALASAALFALLASGIARTASRAGMRGALVVSGAASLVGMWAAYAANTAFNNAALTPSQAKHRIAHAVSSFAKAIP